MRKIEQVMNFYVQYSLNGKYDNTEVKYDAEADVSEVYLHGNLIAKIGDSWMQLFDGGHQTKTTKSRLNALLTAHGCPGEHVFQKDFKWFLNMQGGPVPFFSGMRLN